MDPYIIQESVRMAGELGIVPKVVAAEETHAIHVNIGIRYLGRASDRWGSFDIWDDPKHTAVLATDTPGLTIREIVEIDNPILLWGPDRERRSLRFSSRLEMARFADETYDSEYGITWGSPHDVGSLLWYNHHSCLVALGDVREPFREIVERVRKLGGQKGR
jgi:hypothetical protein